MIILIISITSLILQCNTQTYYLNLPSNNGNVQLSTIPLSNWTAKAFWDGANYNKTGYFDFLNYI